MNREHIQRLLGEAAKLTNHRDYVIIGSLSVLGAVATPPDTMVHSIDIDLYPKNDPGRTAEIASHLGLGSDFEQSHAWCRPCCRRCRKAGSSAWFASNSRTVLWFARTEACHWRGGAADAVQYDLFYASIKRKKSRR